MAGKYVDTRRIQCRDIYRKREMENKDKKYSISVGHVVPVLS